MAISQVALLTHHKLESEDFPPDLDTALRRAAAVGMHEHCSVLVGLGADVNAQDNQSRQTALHQAATNGHEETINFLLSQGARWTIQDNNDQTAEMLAAANGYQSCVDLLTDPSNPFFQSVDNLFLIAMQMSFQKLLKAWTISSLWFDTVNAVFEKRIYDAIIFQLSDPATENEAAERKEHILLRMALFKTLPKEYQLVIIKYLYDADFDSDVDDLLDELIKPESKRTIQLTKQGHHRVGPTKSPTELVLLEYVFGFTAEELVYFGEAICDPVIIQLLFRGDLTREELISYKDLSSVRTNSNGHFYNVRKFIKRVTEPKAIRFIVNNYLSSERIWSYLSVITHPAHFERQANLLFSDDMFNLFEKKYLPTSELSDEQLRLICQHASIIVSDNFQKLLTDDVITWEAIFKFGDDLPLVINTAVVKKLISGFFTLDDLLAMPDRKNCLSPEGLALFDQGVMTVSQARTISNANFVNNKRALTGLREGIYSITELAEVYHLWGARGVNRSVFSEPAMQAMRARMVSLQELASVTYDQQIGHILDPAVLSLIQDKLISFERAFALISAINTGDISNYAVSLRVLIEIGFIRPEQFEDINLLKCVTLNANLLNTEKALLAIEGGLISIEQLTRFEPLVLKRVLTEENIDALLAGEFTIEQLLRLPHPGGFLTEHAIRARQLGVVDIQRAQGLENLALFYSEGSVEALQEGICTLEQAAKLFEGAQGQQFSLSELGKIIFTPIARMMFREGFFQIDEVKMLGIRSRGHGIMSAIVSEAGLALLRTGVVTLEELKHLNDAQALKKLLALDTNLLAATIHYGLVVLTDFKTQGRFGRLGIDSIHKVISELYEEKIKTLDPIEELQEFLGHKTARAAMEMGAITSEFLHHFTYYVAKEIVSERFLKIFLRELENTELLPKVLGIETLVSPDGIRALELGIMSIRQASEFATADELKTAINNGLAQHDAAIKIQSAWRGHTVRASLAVPSVEADGESELAANSVKQLGASA